MRHGRHRNYPSRRPPAFAGPRIPRRLRAFFRLAALKNRRALLAAALEFADARVQADAGLAPRRHRHDWLEAFLAR
jgi:hypothetical protein